MVAAQLEDEMGNEDERQQGYEGVKANELNDDGMCLFPCSEYHKISTSK